MSDYPHGIYNSCYFQIGEYYPYSGWYTSDFWYNVKDVDRKKQGSGFLKLRWLSVPMIGEYIKDPEVSSSISGRGMAQ